MLVRRGIAVFVGLLALAVLAPPAQATFPGNEGKIAFHTNRDGNFEIYVMDANGANETRLTTAAGSDVSPVWSADGTKIVFTSARDGNNEIYSMNPDGSGQTRLTNNAADDVTPSWSVDGAKVYFATNRDGNHEIYSMNANGTSPARITNNPALDAQPVVSPTGDKIAFLTTRTGNNEIYLMNADGSSRQNVSQRADQTDSEPNWDPHGTGLVFQGSNGPDPNQMFETQQNFACCQLVGLGFHDAHPAYTPEYHAGTSSDEIVFATTRYELSPRQCSPCNYEIAIYNRGTFSTNALTATSFISESPDWQPVAKQYARPQAAAVRKIALVPFFQQCAPTQQNSNPRSQPARQSCVPPRAGSGYLTLGSPEANGVPANGNGFVKLNVLCNGGAPNEPPPCNTTAGDQLDGRVIVSQTDVRCQRTGGGCPSALADYVGNLMLELDLRATDRTSGGFGAATIEDFTLRLPVPCATTGAGNVGSTCAVTSSFEAVLGGTTNITEAKRTIWDVRSTRVHDGGADGVATTLADNTQFLSDGLFFP